MNDWIHSAALEIAAHFPDSTGRSVQFIESTIKSHMERIDTEELKKDVDEATKQIVADYKVLRRAKVPPQVVLKAMASHLEENPSLREALAEVEVNLFYRQ